MHQHALGNLFFRPQGTIKKDFLKNLSLIMENFSHDQMVEIQFKRGGRKVLYEGYNYNYKKNAPDKIIWRCRTSGRNFYLRTNLEMAILSVTEHSNEADFEKNLTEFAYRKC